MKQQNSLRKSPCKNSEDYLSESVLVIVQHAHALTGKAGRIAAMRGGEGCHHLTKYITYGCFDEIIIMGVFNCDLYKGPFF